MGTCECRCVDVRERPAAAAAAAVAAGVATFQACLACGAPWGRVAWGGLHAGVLPPKLRMSSAVSAGVWLGVVGAAIAPPTAPRRWSLTGLAPLLLVGAVLNAISPSKPERWWAVVAGLEAALVWAVAREGAES